MTEGTVRRSKCLAGDGQIELESDEAIAKQAIAFRNKKKKSKLLNKTQPKWALSDDSFVAVRLDSQGCVERIYAESD